MTDDGKAARLQQALGPVRERFRRRCADDLTRLNEPGGLETADLHAVAHRLAGMGATMGYPDLTLAARAIDACLTSGGSPASDQIEALRLAMAAASNPP